MHINAHYLKPVSNFIAKVEEKSPVLCLELAPKCGGILTLFFHSEKELEDVIELMLEGRELFDDANREYREGAKNGTNNG